MRTPSSRRRSGSSHILRRVRGRAIAVLLTARRAFRRRRPSPGALLRTPVGPVTRRPTTPITRARSHPTPTLPRHARKSIRHIRQNASSRRRRSRTTKSGRSRSRRRGTRKIPQRCPRSGHSRRVSRRSQGRGARQVQKEPGKLLHSRREGGHGCPSCNRSNIRRPSRNHSRLRGNRLHTLLDSSSGPSCCSIFTQARRRSRQSLHRPRAVNRAT